MKTRENLLLEKYYDVDEETKSVKITLKYSTASELIDSTLDNDEYLINTNMIENINKHLKNIPAIYKTDVVIKIDDFGDINETKFMEAVNDVIELNHYSLERENKRKWITTAILVVVGIIILFFNVIAKANNWYGSNETSTNIASEVFDICAWVFIWEAVSVMFLTPTELSFNSNKFKIRVRSLSFYNKNKEIGCLKFDLTNLKWDSIKKIDVFSHRLFLIGGTMLIGVGFCGIIRNISLIPDTYNAFSDEFNKVFVCIALAVIFTIYFLTNIFEIICGIATLSSYAGRGYLKNKAKYFNYILIGLIIFSLITIPFNGVDFKENLVTYLIYLIFLTGFVLERIINIIKKRELNKANKKISKM